MQAMSEKNSLGDANIQRKTVWQSVYHGKSNDKQDWPGERLIDVMTWLQNKYNNIPEDARDTATCDIESDINKYQDMSFVTIDIGYYRLETDEEFAQRMHFLQSAEEHAATCSNERELLKQLYAKYADNTEVIQLVNLHYKYVQPSLRVIK